jgi:tryptophan-rich sensory protein
MGKINWKNMAFWILAAEAVGVLSGLLSRSGMRNFNEFVEQPPLSPPMWLFPVVWGILYALMGVSASLVSQSQPSPDRNRGLNLMVSQLVVNFFWSLFFFNLQAYGFSLLWLLFLWLLVLWMILTFRKTVPLAAYLQIPYLLWLTFAAYLNAGVWYLNK